MKKSTLSVVGIIFVVVLIIFVTVKGLVRVIWSSPEVTTTYAVDGNDGRYLKIIFLPDNKEILYYKDINTEFEEYGLSEAHGVYGTHYFWGLWKLNGPGFMHNGLLGMRIYSSGIEPVEMEQKTIKKYINGNGDSNFPKINETTNTTYLFKDNAVKFQDMWLQKVETDNQFVGVLLENLNK